MFEDESSQYRIVYPGGDQTRLSVVEIVPALSYEIDDYSVASRKVFDNEGEAMAHAVSLAKQHGLTTDFSRPRLLD